MSPTGQYFAADLNASNSCEDVVTGNVSVTGSNFSGSIDATKDIYSGAATYANCSGAAAVLNGRTGTGLFTLDDQVSPSELTGGVAVTLSNGSANGSVIVAMGTLTLD